MKNHLILLRRILNKRFDAEGLRNLCFDLGIDYDDLPSRGKAAKARELVSYLERCERIPECLQVGRQLRPDIPWVKLELAWLKAAQKAAPNQRRFQPLIEELEIKTAHWEKRLERQRERIAEGLHEEYEKLLEGQSRRQEREQLAIIGQPPLNITCYFKNRQRELTKLTQMLSEPTTRLISVIGHGGMGKTALACKVLQDLERHRWPQTDESLPPIDGIVYLSTRTAGISLERVFLDCAKLLGGECERSLNAIWTSPQLSKEEKTTRLLNSLNDGRYVILLDNLEDLLDSHGQFLDDDLRLFFERILVSDGSAQLVVTSRVGLTFRREVMRFDRQVNMLEGLPVKDGVALLRELDPNGDYGLRDALEERLAEAVELTHGVPRALEVLAGILANDPFANLEEVLETFYEQEDVVQALIEENYRRLDQDARRIIEALAVFKRPISVLAVDYLLEPFAPGLDAPNIVRRLTRSNIVSVDRVAKTVTLHPIDQEYTYSRLPEEGRVESNYTRQALERRAADYYAQLRTPEDTWESIEDLEPQLNEFEHSVRAGSFDQACRVLETVDHNYLYLWGHYSKLISLRELLVTKLRDKYNQTYNFGRLGMSCRNLGRFEEAIAFHRRALDLARKAGYRRMEAYQLSGLGLVWRAIGRFDLAIDYFRQSLQIAHEIGDHQEESAQLGHLGISYHALGQMGEAVEALSQALDIDHRNKDTRNRGIHIGFLGEVCYSLDQIDLSLRCFRKALAIAREIGFRRHEVSWLNNIANAHLTKEEFGQSIGIFNQALIIAREIGHPRGESHSLLGLSQAYFGLGKLRTAKRLCQETIAIEIARTRIGAVFTKGCILLQLQDPSANSIFKETISYCYKPLERTPKLYRTRYQLAAALVGQAVCNPCWAHEDDRPDLLAPALQEYHRALAITVAPGVIQEATQDLELIRAAGIQGLESVFELLENAEYEPDEDLYGILREIETEVS